MKRFALFLLLRPAVVIGTLPNTISNGQTEDATPLMANFNWIVNQVNAAGLAVTSLTPQLASANTFTGLQSGISATQLANFPIATQIINASLTDCGSAGGTANALTLTTAITIAAYAAGQEFAFLATANNSGAATVNVDALGAKSIVNLDASALVANQIKSGGAFSVRYDGTNFQLLNPNLKTVPGGGTGVATLAAHGVVLGNGTSAVNVTGAGTTGQVLTSNGASADPTFQTVGGALVFLASATPTAAANVDFLSTFSSTYDNIRIIIDGIKAAGDTTLVARLATGGAADTGSNYSVGMVNNSPSTLAQTSFGIDGTITAAGKGLSAVIDILNVNDATNIKVMIFSGAYQNAATPGWSATIENFTYYAANTVSGVRFYWASGGNFSATGKIRIYGYTNA